MNEIEIRSRLRKAMGEYDYKPRSSTELEAGLVRGAPSRHLGAMGVVAAVLAILIVVSLVYVRVHSTHPTLPAESPSPSSSIPMSVLESAHIAAAGALVSHPNLQGTVAGRTVTLVGAYADAWNLTLIFRVSPASNTPLGISVWTDSGPFEPPSYPLTVAPDGYQYFESGGAVAPTAGGPAHLQASIWDHVVFLPNDAASGARLPDPAWTFTYSLEVHAAASLPAQQGVIPVGSWKVTILKFEMTPSTIYTHTLIDGPPPLEKSSTPSNDGAKIAIESIEMLDGAGTAVTFERGGGGWGVSAGYGRVWEVSFEWPRPTQATTYRLVITGGGGQYSTSFAIPDPPTS